MYRKAANVARSAWDRGPYGKLLAALWVGGVALTLGGVRAAVTHAPQWAWASGAACGLAGVDLQAHARGLVANTGLEASETLDAGAPTFRVGAGAWTVGTASAVCDTTLRLHQPIADRWPTDVPFDVGTSLALGRWYDTAGAMVVPGDAAAPVALVLLLPLHDLNPATLASRHEALAATAEAWRAGWFDAAMATLRGATPPPASLSYAPGQDPASKLAEVEAFLKAHGAGLPAR